MVQMSKKSDKTSIKVMTERQRKTNTLLVQFIIFLVVTVAGTVIGINDSSGIWAVNLLVIAGIVTIRLAVLCKVIWSTDKNKFWVQCVVASLIASTIFAIWATEGGVNLGIFAFGIAGLVCTMAHFAIWRIASFFMEHTNPMPSSNAQQNYDIRDLTKEARAYILRFDKLFAEIPNFKRPPISKQTTHLRAVYIQVHDVLAKNPDIAHLANELIDYHFPQTLKLLENYGDFTKKKVKVANIEQILDDLTQSFDTLSSAVDAQLNNLYAGMVLDVKTDKAVIENMAKK